MCQIEELEAGTPGRLKVTAKSTETDEMIEGEYNTVCIASVFLHPSLCSVVMHFRQKSKRFLSQLISVKETTFSVAIITILWSL